MALKHLPFALVFFLLGCGPQSQDQAPSPASPSSTDSTPAPQTSATQLPEVVLHIGPSHLNTEIASTQAEQETGLMFREEMPDNHGMIFLLPNVGMASFWMKNTLLPLSIAFIDRNGVILEVHDMKALDTTILHSDSDQVAYALETNLHWFALNHIKPGDKIDPSPATLGHSP